MAAGLIGAAVLAGGASSGQWNPPQFQKPATYFVTINGSTNAPATSNTLTATGGNITMNGTTIQTYVFDAVMRAEHDQSAQITSQPIQTGANISDHAYAMPARVTLEIGMSDVMVAYSSGNPNNSSGIKSGAWTGPSQSKSVNAFNEIVSWATGRLLLTLGTRLKTYSSMMVESINPEESNKTVAALKCRVTFKQVFIANSQQIGVSALPQTTQTSSGGATTGSPPTASQINQFQVTDPTTVQGGGPWSSVSSANA
jgi:hypothetical protein